MHAHPHVMSTCVEKGSVNSGVGNPEVNLAMLTGLSYHDGFKNPWLPANRNRARNTLLQSMVRKHVVLRHRKGVNL